MVESCSFFFFKQKTAYEMRISDWSSDVCSSDLPTGTSPPKSPLLSDPPDLFFVTQIFPHRCILQCYTTSDRKPSLHHIKTWVQKEGHCGRQRRHSGHALRATVRSEEHTSELQSLMRISYAVFCLKKKLPTQSMQRTAKYISIT